MGPPYGKLPILFTYHETISLGIQKWEGFSCGNMGGFGVPCPTGGPWTKTTGNGSYQAEEVVSQDIPSHHREYDDS